MDNLLARQKILCECIARASKYQEQSIAQLIIVYELSSIHLQNMARHYFWYIIRKRNRLRKVTLFQVS